MVNITSETWTGTTGAVWPAARWATGRNGTGSTATIQSNVGRLVNGSEAAYNGSGRVSRRLVTGNVADAVVVYRFRWPNAAMNNYAGFWLRSNGSNANLLDGQTGIYFVAAQDFGGWKIQAASNYGALAGWTDLSVTKTWASNTWYWVRFGIVGTAIKARVWNDGAAEPTTWDVESSQGNLLTGSGAWGFSVGQGGTPSAVTEFDDFSADTAFPSAGTNYNVTASGIIVPGHTVSGRVNVSGDVTANTVANSAVSVPIQKLSTFTDQFDTPDGLKWDNVQGANPTVTGGEFRVTPDPGYPSTFSELAYDLSNSSAFVQVKSYPNSGNGTVQSWPMQLRRDSGNFAQWVLTGNSLIAEHFTDGNANVVATIPDYTGYNWLRIRDIGGTVYWDHSADGTMWVNDGFSAVPWDKTQVFVYLAAGYYGTEPDPGTLVLDNFNVAPVISGTVSQSVTAGGSVVGRSGPVGAVSGTATAGHVVVGVVGVRTGAAQATNAGSSVSVGVSSSVTGTASAGHTVAGTVGVSSAVSGTVAAGHVVSGPVGKLTGTTQTTTATGTVGTGKASAVSGVVTANPVVDGSVSAQDAVSAPQNIGGFLSAADGISGSFTVNMPVPTGRFVLVTVVTNGDNPSLSISDSKGHTWTRLSTASRSTGTLTTATAFYTFITTALTTSDTVTVVRGSSGTLLFSGMMFSGVNTVLPIGNGGTQATATGTGTSLSSGALATAASKSVVVMVAGMNQAYFTAAPGSGYTEFADASSMGSNARGATVIYRNITTTATYTPVSNVGFSVDWVALGFVLAGAGVSSPVTGPVMANYTVSGYVTKTSGVVASVVAVPSVGGRSGPAGAVTGSALAGSVVSGSVAGSVGVSGPITAGSVVSGLAGLSGAVEGQTAAGHTVSGFLTTGPTGAVSAEISPAVQTAVRLGKTSGVNAPVTASAATTTRLGLRPEVVAGVVQAGSLVAASKGERATVAGSAIAHAVVTGLVLTGTEARTGFVVGSSEETYFITDNPDSTGYPVVVGS